ncbi:conserved hypothetical protein, partial [Ixodes scapularis]
NAAEKWRPYKQAINFYLKATETASKLDDQKVAVLLTVSGAALLDAYNTIDFGTPAMQRPHPKPDYKNGLVKLGSHFVLKQNKVYSRYSFKQHFELYVTGTGQKNKSDEQKVALLLTLVGSGIIDVYNTLDFGEPTATVPEQGKTLSVVVEKFNNYFVPRANEVYAKYLLRCRKQEQGEAFDAFLTDLKVKVKGCNYKGQGDKMIRNQVIFGINYEGGHMKLLKLE